MNAIALVHALGSSGLFASRMFAPALATAALLRFGPQIPGLDSLGLLASLHAAPGWFTSDACLLTLLVLTAAEVVGDKVPEVREAIATMSDYLKPVLAAATALGVISMTDTAFAQGLVFQAGLGAALPALVAAAGTAAAVVIRRGTLGWLEALDPNDTLQLRRLWSWAEDSWAMAGAVLLVVLPAAMAAVLCLAMLGLAVLRRRQRARDKAQRRPCPHCQTPLDRCAPTCGACHTSNPAPRGVGMLGQALAAPATDIDRHAADLLAQLRCPECAARLTRGRVAQICPTCGAQPFVPADKAQRFLAAIDARAAPTAAVVAVVSLVPLLGYLVGALYGELRLVAPLRVHLPLTQRWLLKWPLRLLRWLVVVVQVVPLVGGVAAAAELLVRYRVHRAALAGQLAALRPATRQL
ncbi:MAG: zinc ribbon domain-containing protein [Deltaproteobacteria bacterium]|nr:zinc ribbon domain-containing protein [Deltaproteobacteria bacterium]